MSKERLKEELHGQGPCGGVTGRSRTMEKSGRALVFQTEKDGNLPRVIYMEEYYERYRSRDGNGTGNRQV